MKILNSKNKNFDKYLDLLLLKRKSRIKSNTVSVVKIIRDVKKNGDKAVIKYEKRSRKKQYIYRRILDRKSGFRLRSNRWNWKCRSDFKREIW